MVRPKKFLGQHFLKETTIARRIVDALELPANEKAHVLEIGPGTGVLTKFLLEREDLQLTVVEVDYESVAFLRSEFPALNSSIYEEDFLQMDIEKKLGTPLDIIGNFPYNISSQIFFKVLDNRQQ
ncbi:MAG TPA: rRNA adenine N-6-methyltransferase family protein, partial [Cyclobacteriaceae bacterium]|nr:rRNA adenine N-6-methyltransferase family protein [Cyclobacteriaceae bacterium]